VGPVRSGAGIGDRHWDVALRPPSSSADTVANTDYRNQLRSALTHRRDIHAPTPDGRVGAKSTSRHTESNLRTPVLHERGAVVGSISMSRTASSRTLWSDTASIGHDACAP
jgi:hypothetical protein